MMDKAANIILKKCLDVKKQESVLIITDENLKPIGNIIFECAKKITSKTKLIQIPVGDISGQEPPEYVAREMLKYDVIIIPTTKSLTHTNAVKNASSARVATLPGITEDIMKRSLDVDYELMKTKTEKLKQVLDKTNKIRIKTSAGTDLVFSIKQRTAKADIGLLIEKGIVGNLPAGEAFIAPVEGSANGKLVIDGSVLGKKIRTPIIVMIKDGFAVDIKGFEALPLIKLLKKVRNKNAFNIAEFGIGTNSKARVTGKILEDEKCLGTAHIAFGSNFSFGGTVNIPVHIDGIFYNPSVFVDDKKIISHGRILL